jgi:hypothetical protein
MAARVGKKKDEIKLLDRQDLVCVHIQSKDGEKQLPLEWSPGDWTAAVSSQVCPDATVIEHSGRVGPALPLGVEVFFSVEGTASSKFPVSVPSDFTLSHDGTDVEVVGTVFRCGPLCELNAAEAYCSDDAGEKADGILMTLPQHWIVPDREYVPRKPHTSLFAGQAWYKFLQRFGKVASGDVYFTTAQGAVKTNDKEVFLLVKFQAEDAPLKCVKELQNRIVEQGGEKYMCCVRVVKADLFKNRTKEGGFPSDGVMAGMPFEHPHSFLDYAMDLMKSYGTDTELSDQALEIVSALLRSHPEAQKELQGMTALQLAEGGEQIEIIKGDGDKGKLGTIVPVERLEEVWPASPNYTPPVPDAPPPQG